MDKVVVGLIEEIEISGRNKKKILAKFDTGATRSAVDFELASELELGPVVGKTIVRTNHGVGKRAIVRAMLNICGKEIEANVSLSDREKNKYKLLIGRDVIHSNFIIDPSKSNSNLKESSILEK